MNKKILSCLFVSMFFLILIPYLPSASADTPANFSKWPSSGNGWEGSYWSSGDPIIGPYIKNIKWGGNWVANWVNIPAIEVNTPDKGWQVCGLYDFSNDATFPSLNYYDTTHGPADGKYHIILIDKQTNPCYYWNSQNNYVVLVNSVQITFDLNSAATLWVHIQSTTPQGEIRNTMLFTNPGVSVSSSADSTQSFQYSEGSGGGWPWQYAQPLWENQVYIDESEGSGGSMASISSVPLTSTTPYAVDLITPQHDSNGDGVYNIIFYNKCDAGACTQSSNSQFTNGPGQYEGTDSVYNVQLQIDHFMIYTSTNPAATWTGDYEYSYAHT